MNITIRSATKNDLRGISIVHVDTWKSTYKGLMPDDFLADLQYEKSEERFRKRLENQSDDQFLFVAVDVDNKVVGFADGGAERSGEYKDYGEVYGIYILKDYQRMGIGKKLIDQATLSLKRNGFHKMIIWVLKNNKYEKFYQDLGGKKAGKKTQEINNITLNLVSYIWDKI